VPDKDVMPLNSNPRHPIGCKRRENNEILFPSLRRWEREREEEIEGRREKERVMIIAKLFIKRASK